MRLRNGKKDEGDALRLLKWIGKAVNLACNTGVYPFKDNEASRLKANEAKANKLKLKQEKKKEEERRERKKKERNVYTDRGGTYRKRFSRSLG